MTTPNICDLLDEMDERRHLPKYQLELRASPIFEWFLHGVLEERFGCEFKSTIIPEFPLRHGTLGTNEGSKKANQSVNADFFALSTDSQCGVLVELKTDTGSITESQISYLKIAKTKRLKCLVEGVICISKATTHYGKYAHLLHRLSLLRLVSGCDEVCKLASCEKKNGWKSAVGKVSNTVQGEVHTKVVYILPNYNPIDEGEENDPVKKVGEVADCIITFKQFADIVAKRGPIGKRFAESLVRWANHPAGSVPPGK